MRALSLYAELSPAWVICVKETVTVAVVGPWLVYQTLRGQLTWPNWGTLLALVVVALGVQVIGNQGLMWAFRMIGISISIPAMMGMNLLSSATRLVCPSRTGQPTDHGGHRTLDPGRRLVEDRSRAGLRVDHHRFAHGRPGGEHLRAAAGFIFASMAVAIRKTVTRTTPMAVILVLFTFVGTLSLAPLSVCQMGVSGILATPASALGLMLLAGVLNLIGFFSITKGLQFATVVQANVISASQVAMAAVIGMLFFQETPSSSITVGVCLTIAGMVMIERPS